MLASAGLVRSRHMSPVSASIELTGYPAYNSTDNEPWTSWQDNLEAMVPRKLQLRWIFLPGYLRPPSGAGVVPNHFHPGPGLAEVHKY